MKEYLTEWIRLNENFKLQDGDSSSVLALYQFADRLSQLEEIEAKKVLVDVYQKLGMMESAFKVFSTMVDKTDRKQMKKFATLQELSKKRGDDFALPRPLTVVEKAERQEHLKDLPYFRYHPDPLITGAFEEGEEQICPCCGKNQEFIMLCGLTVSMMSTISVRCASQMGKQRENSMRNLFKKQNGPESQMKRKTICFSTKHQDT